MGRRYIGGVGSGSSFFKQSNNPGDYTTKDIFVERGLGLKSFTIPKGTYIGVGAIDKGFMDVLPENDRTRKFDAQDYLEQARAEGRDISWYEENKDKTNYGYEDPETFLKDTYGRYSMIEDGTYNIDQLLEFQTEDYDGRPIVTADAGEGSASMSFVPHYELPYNIKKIKPKKIDKIDIEQPEVNMQLAPEVQDSVRPSKADLFFERLETAKVYENRPDEFSDKAAKNVRGRKKVTTQYVFSDDNPFKPDGRYFMGGVDAKGKRKTSGNLNKAREWERKFGLGTQKDIVGYIPSLEFGG